VVDIAARTEFYTQLLNPQSKPARFAKTSTGEINALAVRLTPRAGELLDLRFTGFRSKADSRLHANSFIEDPTRIYRAVRFAVRLDLN